MSDIGKAVFEKLSSVTEITNVVSTRIFPGVLRQNVTLPAMTYRVISDVPDNHIAGAGDLANARIQIDCYAATDAAVKSLKELVRVALDGVTTGYGSIEIFESNLEGGNDFQENPIEGSDVWRYGYTQDFLISYNRN